ncbi:MAG: polysaccharide deacetylase family protein [Ilumatobacteraceae bacterium]
MKLRPPALAAGCVGGAMLLAHMVPSVLLLGQWAPTRATRRPRCIWRGADRPRIALTFDDGPQPGTTELVLDRLDSLELKATFFCLGQHVAKHPELTREIAARGHEVATHGHVHQSHFRHSPAWVAADLQHSIEAIGEAGVAPPRWFRPPYGHVTAGTLMHAHRNGLPLVLWSAMGKEWVEPSAAAVARRVETSLCPGAIVLLHDAEINAGSAGRVIDALPHLASTLDARRWSASTLGELMSLT